MARYEIAQYFAFCSCLGGYPGGGGGGIGGPLGLLWKRSTDPLMTIHLIGLGLFIVLLGCYLLK